MVIVLNVNSLFFSAVVLLKDADGMANSVDPDQTAHGFMSSLILVHTVCWDLSVPVVGIFVWFISSWMSDELKDLIMKYQDS